MRIAIVGSGPRTLLMLERLCGHLNSRRHPPAGPMTLHLIGQSRIGHSDPDTRHSQLLLVNTPANELTAFGQPGLVTPGSELACPTLSEWAGFTAKTDASLTLPEPARTEAGALSPHDYPSRYLYGFYLRWAFEYLRRLLPSTIRVIEHQATVTAVCAPGTESDSWISLSTGAHLTGLAAVVFTDRRYWLPPARHSTDHDLLPGAWMPLRAPSPDLSVRSVQPQQRVAVLGLGPRFTDVVTVLTSGRGGKFTSRAGTLKYHPSGREPVIVAGSSTGIPPYCRPVYDSEHPSTALTPVTEQRISELADRLDRNTGGAVGRRPEFGRDVWPLISESVEVAYYSALLRRRLSPSEMEYFQQRYLQAWEHTRPDLLDCNNVERHLHWDWQRRISPAHDLHFGDSIHYHQWLVGHINEDVRHARLGPARSPYSAATAALRQLHPQIRKLVAHPNLTPLSAAEKFWYEALYGQLACGVPAQRAEELAALIRAGVVHIVGPDIHHAPGSTYQLHSPTVRGSHTVADLLIDTDADVKTLRSPADSRCHVLASGAEPDRPPAIDYIVCESADRLIESLLEDDYQGDEPTLAPVPADQASTASPVSAAAAHFTVR